jgi:hypothetical protein
VKVKIDKIETILFYSLLGIGFILAFFQLYYNRSLWLDEAFLANNIIRKSWLELGGTLEYNTASPFLYSIILKTFGSIFCFKDYVLRIPSLMAFILGIFLIKKYLDRDQIQISTQIIIFSLIFFNPFFIRYNSELKQYMMDFLAVGVYLLLVQKLKYDVSSSKTDAIILVAYCFLSHAAILLTISFSILHFINFLKNRRTLKFDILFYLIIFAGFILIYFTQFAINNNKDFQYQYWVKAGAFLPIGSGAEAIFSFLVQKYKMVCYDMIPMLPKLNIYGFSIAIIGLIGFIISKKYTKLIIFITPIFIHLTVSGVGVYPFEKRYVLYLVVLTIIGVAIGIQYLVQAKLSKWFKSVNWIIITALIVLITIGFSKISFPIEVEELKPLLVKLDRLKKKEDVVFVYYYSQPILEFYQLSSGLLKNLSYVTLEENRTNPKKYELYFSSVGKTGWVLLSHIYPGEKEIILNILSKNGMKINSIDYTKACMLIQYQKK